MQMVSAAPPDPGEELEYAELDFGDGCMFTNVPVRAEVGKRQRVRDRGRETEERQWATGACSPNSRLVGGE